MSRDDAERLNRKIDELAGGLPASIARAIHWLREPAMLWVRIPLALLLIACGFVGFLPILGFWMVPLGLLLLAQDVPFLQRPILSLVIWLERAWRRLRARFWG